MNMVQVERHYIKENEQILILCKASKELYNRCNFLMRQTWINHKTLPDISKLIQVLLRLDRSVAATPVIVNPLRKKITKCQSNLISIMD